MATSQRKDQGQEEEGNGMPLLRATLNFMQSWHKRTIACFVPKARIAIVQRFKGSEQSECLWWVVVVVQIGLPNGFLCVLRGFS